MTSDRLRLLVAEGISRLGNWTRPNAAAAATARTRSATVAREQHVAAQGAIDTVDSGIAAVQAREAALIVARRLLADTTVRAPHDGRVVGLTVSSGEMVAPSQIPVHTRQFERMVRVREFPRNRAATDQHRRLRDRLFDDRPGKTDQGGRSGHRIGCARRRQGQCAALGPYVAKSVNWVPR